MSQLCEIMRHLTHSVSHSTELITQRSDGTLTIRSTFLRSSCSQFNSLHSEAEADSSHRVSENASMWWWVGAKREGVEQSLGVESCHHSSAVWSYIHKYRQRSITYSRFLWLYYTKQWAVSFHSEGFGLLKGSFSCHCSLVGSQVSAISSCKVELNWTMLYWSGKTVLSTPCWSPNEQ